MPQNPRLLGETSLLTSYLGDLSVPDLDDMDGVAYPFEQLKGWLRPLRMRLFICACNRHGHSPTEADVANFHSRNETNMGAWRSFCAEIAQRVSVVTGEECTYDEIRGMVLEQAPVAVRDATLTQANGRARYNEKRRFARRITVTASFAGTAELVMGKIDPDGANIILSDDGSPEIVAKPDPMMWERGHFILTGEEMTPATRAILKEDSLKNIVEMAKKYPDIVFIFFAIESLEAALTEVIATKTARRLFESGRLVIVEDFEPLCELF